MKRGTTENNKTSNNGTEGIIMTTNKTDTEKALECIAADILKLEKETSGNKDYNAQNLAADALRITREYFRTHAGANIEFIPGEPNTKTGIRSIDLLPYITCHARCRETCGKIKKGCKFNKGKCYAYKLLYRNPSTAARYAINTALAIYRPRVFWTGVEKFVHCERFVRCFVSGDGRLPGFFDNLFRVMMNNKHCMVQGFTKCYEQYNACIEKYGKQDNIKFLLSGWNELKPDNPHNLPISDVYDDVLPDGWLSCGGNCYNCGGSGVKQWRCPECIAAGRI